MKLSSGSGMWDPQFVMCSTNALTDGMIPNECSLGARVADSKHRKDRCLLSSPSLQIMCRPKLTVVVVVVVIIVVVIIVVVIVAVIVVVIQL